MNVDDKNKYCPINRFTACEGEKCAWWSEEQQGCAVAGAELLLDLISYKFDELLKLLDKSKTCKKK